MARPNRRGQLLDAAIAVIRRDGAHALTLDAVAAEAGVSKGGVLYHFGSKRALVDGLIGSWLDTFDVQLDPDDFAASYVRACDLSAAGPEINASEFGMLAALIDDPEVLEVARDRYAEWMERMLGGALAREDAWLVRLAADGLWYSDLLGIAAPEGDDRRRLIGRLLALAAGESR
jgi:AcrR family transcriptional regulator